MRICRFGDDRVGLVVGDSVHDVTRALDLIPAYRYPLPGHDPLIAHLPELRSRIFEVADQSPALSLASLELLSPIANAGKVLAAPVNYKKHLDEARADPEIHHQNQIMEIRRVGLFLKATSSVIGAGQSVVIRHQERRNDHEIELVAVIGKRADRVRAVNALDYVAGYCIGLDMTVRGPEERSLRKSIDTYTVLGPWLTTADEIGDPTELDLHLTVNGEPRQRANTKDLVISLPELIEFASSYYTLMPGDVLFTGTPEGVSPVEPGDVLKASITGLGSMQVRVE